MSYFGVGIVVIEPSGPITVLVPLPFGTTIDPFAGVTPDLPVPAPGRGAGAAGGVALAPAGGRGCRVGGGTTVPAPGAAGV
jgi:hypothetical protein